MKNIDPGFPGGPMDMLVVDTLNTPGSAQRIQRRTRFGKFRVDAGFLNPVRLVHAY
ncbi:MAG: hypothetical protein MUF76_14940 [Hydrogenophaga sp.]|nr:hypothetical protein [Hydrogenophaga sp.]